ncbi:hypothetical protein KY310_01705 [Candidatus Woesearchaeota archaeon]|nr:hypothetical protein [Candidatus Woesearchaeota archaeon]
MKLFLSKLKPALKLCYKNKGFFLLSCFIDAVFFLVLLAMNYVFLVGVKDYVTEFIDVAQVEIQTMAQDNFTVMSPALLKSQELLAPYHMIIKYAVVFILAAFLAWIIFKGLNWFIANRLIRKVKPKEFAKRFIIHTILAFLCLIIIFIILMRLISYSSFSFLPLISDTGARVLALLLIWILAYFLAISYSTNLSCKELTRAGIKHYKELVPAHLVIFIGFLLLSYLTVEVIKYHYWAPVFVALFVTIPFVTYGRIYIVVVVNQVLKRGR